MCMHYYYSDVAGNAVVTLATPRREASSVDRPPAFAARFQKTFKIFKIESLSLFQNIFAAF